jgi:hypothetical protein
VQPIYILGQDGQPLICTKALFGSCDRQVALVGKGSCYLSANVSEEFPDAAGIGLNCRRRSMAGDIDLFPQSASASVGWQPRRNGDTCTGHDHDLSIAREIESRCVTHAAVVRAT